MTMAYCVCWNPTRMSGGHGDAYARGRNVTVPPQGTQAQPTPFTVDLGEARVPDGTTLAVLIVKKVTGQDMLFCTPVELAAIAEQLATHAATLANKPIIATAMPAGLPAPGGNGSQRR